MLDEKGKFDDAHLESLLPEVKFSRRGFLASSASVAGFALSAGPVAAQTAITTDSEGIVGEDIKVKVNGGDMPGYIAAPAKAGKYPTVLVVPALSSRPLL